MIITDMINLTIKEEQMPDVCEHSTIKQIVFNWKGDTTMCGNYWDLKLLEHTMKVLEYIAETIIRH